MSDPDGDAILAEDVVKEYTVRGRPDPVRALRGVSLKVPRGARVAIMGRSGSGKTTFLQIVGALDLPSSGRIVVAGRDLTHLSETDLTDYRAKTVGFVFQNFQLIPTLSAVENVELALEAVNVPPNERRGRALQLLESVGMGPRAAHRPGKLSSGEQQRVAIARALANDPAILLADEPTGALDTETGEEVLSLIFRLAEVRKTTVIIVTHSDEVSRRCQVVYRIRDGKLQPAEAAPAAPAATQVAPASLPAEETVTISKSRLQELEERLRRAEESAPAGRGPSDPSKP